MRSLVWQLMTVSLVGVSHFSHAVAQDRSATLPPGTLLRVQLDTTSKLSKGASVTGHLLDDIYLIDREFLPAGTLISGHVTGTKPVPGRDRVWPLLNGDLTPLRTPQIVFDHLTLPNGASMPMHAPATERAASLVSMQSAHSHRRLPIISMAKAAAHDRIERLHTMYLAPGKKDRLEKLLFDQLPYHPQRIWRATQFDAELSEPLTPASATDTGTVCADVPTDQLPATTLHARLLTGISSRTAKNGDTVDATLAQPVYETVSKKLLLPQGAHMQGTVIRAKPARIFGRPGVLRFNLKQVSVAPEESCAMQQRSRALMLNGQMTGVEAAPGENVKLNSEGEAQAGPSPNRLLAPLTLAVLLARTYSDDGNNAGTGAVSGGGFGIVGRVVSLATQNANVTSGFAYYALAKSVVRRFILRGHEVEFPRNTRFDIAVTPRTGIELTR